MGLRWVPRSVHDGYVGDYLSLTPTLHDAASAGVETVDPLQANLVIGSGNADLTARMSTESIGPHGDMLPGNDHVVRGQAKVRKHLVMHDRI